MNKLGEKFVLKLGYLMEKAFIPPSVNNESGLEYAFLPQIKKLIQKELGTPGGIDKILYHHGRNTEEKKHWTESKKLQTVMLFGTNVSDMFIVHPKIGAASLEFKYVKLSRTGEGVTGSIQRAIGQSLIATVRHPFAVCVIVYGKQKKHLELGAMKQLKNLLWKHHKIYLVIRKQAL